MEMMDAIHRRRSVRDYASESMARAALDDLIEAATWAPSAVNEQPWLFTVVQDRELLDRISRESKAHMLATMGTGLASHLLDRLKDPGFQIFYHAPALIVIAATSAGPWAVEDCALAAENLMLAAAARGLGTCWIGFAQGWLATPDGKQLLELPTASMPVAPIIVGHPRAIPPAPPRQTARVRWLG